MPRSFYIRLTVKRRGWLKIMKAGAEDGYEDTRQNNFYLRFIFRQNSFLNDNLKIHFLSKVNGIFCIDFLIEINHLGF